jgi:drug/metabolite transporter (DMT)-like permease
MQSLWMIAASFLFACMGVCVKLAAETHSAVEITFYRSFISLILMFGLVRLRGVPLPRRTGAGRSPRGVVGFIRRCSPIFTPSRCCRWRRP